MSSQDLTPPSNSNRNWPTVIGAAAFVVLAIVLLLVVRNPQVGRSSETVAPAVDVVSAFPEGSGVLQIGDAPWAFTLTDVDGNPVALDQFAGRPIVVNFWASWCGPCRIEFPHLQEAANQYGDDVVFLAINQQEDVETVTDYFRDLGLTLPALLDSNAQVAQDYTVGRTLPTTFFIDATGEVNAIHRGPMTFGQIEGYLADALP